MLHVGLDLSRHRLDVRVLEPAGATVAELAVPPEGPELRALAARLLAQGEVRAVIESMTAPVSCMTPWSSPAGTWRSPTR